MVLAIVGVAAEITNTVIDILSSATTSIAGFFEKAWQWLTNDYWIDLSEVKEYTVNAETGEIVEPGTTHDEQGIPITTKTENLTLVDKYVKELGNQGVSIKSLGLLGTADYSDPNLLKDENNKALVEKYMSEFIRADIITQQPHRNKTEDVVNPDNQNLIDGCIYFYRAKESPEIDEDIFANDNYYYEEYVPDTDVEYVQMKYISYEEFQKKLAKKDKDLRLHFTIDQDNGNLIVAKVKKTETIHKVNLLEFKDTSYEYEIVSIDYRTKISKYTMPYEFLIQLCNITYNPEFVYHVALMARDSRIEILIQDDITLNKETEETFEEWHTYRNNSDDTISGAYIAEKSKEKDTKVTTVTTETPKIAVRLANTWSYYDEFEYTKNIEGEKQGGDLIVEEPPVTGPLDEVPEHKETIPSFDGSTIEITVDGYWEKKFLVRREYCAETITASIEYNTDNPIEKKSIHKSKQFLGLLKNKTGKCEETDCFQPWKNPLEEDPIALDCVRQSVFEVEGENVKYTIPNQTKKEEPMEELLSGLDLLYSRLLLNNSGYIKPEQDKDASELYEDQKQSMMSEDYKSAYVSKLQGLVEHFRFLMSFPDPKEEEDVPINYLPGDDDDDDDDDDDSGDSIVPAELAKFFPDGLPQSDAEMQKYLVTIMVPVNNKDGTQGYRSVRVHKDVANDVWAIFDQIQKSGFKAYDIQGYNWRDTSTGTGTRSHHSYGLAIDINVRENYCIKNGKIIAGEFWKPYENEYSITPNGPVVKAFNSKGWIWGGIWKSSKDYMHFSVTGK